MQKGIYLTIMLFIILITTFYNINGNIKKVVIVEINAMTADPKFNISTPQNKIPYVLI